VNNINPTVTTASCFLKGVSPAARRQREKHGETGSIEPLSPPVKETFSRDAGRLPRVPATGTSAVPMKSFTSLFVILILGAAPLVSAQSTRPAKVVAEPKVKRALIISVDGLRPDVLLRADAPRIRGLYHKGAFTFWARSTPASITLPTHVSMLTGASPEAHAIMWNGELPLSQPVYPRVPTIFELAKKRGYTTGLVAGKSKFKILGKPGTIDFADFPDEAKSDDPSVAKLAVEMIRQHKPDLMFVHLPGCDSAGHAKGWGTEDQLAAVTVADGCVGQVLDALQSERLLDKTLVILTADHGGAGRTHGADDFRSRHIPWIAAGPGVRKNYDLTLDRDLVVDVYDTFTTVCTMMDIPVGRKVNGKFVDDILEVSELLRPADTAPVPVPGALK
jgi:hypothetical protein